LKDTWSVAKDQSNVGGSVLKLTRNSLPAGGLMPDLQPIRKRESANAVA
jgi:hypothetical protein